MREKVTPLALTALAIAVAMLIFYAAFADDRERARARCTERGGQVVIESDATSIGQYCVMPDGTRSPL